MIIARIFPFVALVSLTFVGCNCECKDKNKGAENATCTLDQIKWPSDVDRQNWLCQETTDALKDVIAEDFDNAEVASENDEQEIANPMHVPISNGGIDGYNIWLDVMPDGKCFLKFIVKKDNNNGDNTDDVSEVANHTYDLTTEKVQIWIGDKGQIKHSTKSSTWSSNNLDSIQISSYLDLKVFSAAPTTKDFAIIGIDDAREYNGGGGNMYKCESTAIFAALDYKSLNRKRVRIWQDGDKLIIQGNKETKVSKPKLTKKLLTQFQKISWGKFNPRYAMYPSMPCDP